MQPVRQIGPTVAVAAGAAVAITNPSAVVLVANAGAVMGYFSTPSGGAAPAAATGLPIPPNCAIPVALGGMAGFYGAFGAALTVTPVEMMKSQ